MLWREKIQPDLVNQSVQAESRVDKKTKNRREQAQSSPRRF